MMETTALLLTILISSNVVLIYIITSKTKKIRDLNDKLDRSSLVKRDLEQDIKDLKNVFTANLTIGTTFYTPTEEGNYNYKDEFRNTKQKITDIDHTNGLFNSVDVESGRSWDNKFTHVGDFTWENNSIKHKFI